MVLKAPFVAYGCAAISALWVVPLGSGAFESGGWLWTPGNGV